MFYFYNIKYFTKKISAYVEVDELWVIDQFQKFHPLVIGIWASILRAGVLPHVTLHIGACHSVTIARATNMQTQKRNKHVIITSKRRFDVIITCLLRCVFAGYPGIFATHPELGHP